MVEAEATRFYKAGPGQPLKADIRLSGRNRLQERFPDRVYRRLQSADKRYSPDCRHDRGVLRRADAYVGGNTVTGIHIIRTSISSLKQPAIDELVETSVNTWLRGRIDVRPYHVQVNTQSNCSNTDCTIIVFYDSIQKVLTVMV